MITIENLARAPWLARVTRHIPPGQFARYLVVGGFNTLFGYACFALLTLMLTQRLSHAYVLAGLLSSFINITVSFLNYKWFIFKTKGGYLREWMRCVMVYSGGLLIGTILLPVCVFLLRYFTPLHESAPYIAAAVLTVFNVIAGFVGHRKFSFAAGQSMAPNVELPSERKH